MGDLATLDKEKPEVLQTSMPQYSMASSVATLSKLRKENARTGRMNPKSTEWT